MSHRAQQIECFIAGIEVGGVPLTGYLVFPYAAGTTTYRGVYLDAAKTQEAAGSTDIYGKKYFTLQTPMKVYGQGVYKFYIVAPGGNSLSSSVLVIEDASYVSLDYDNASDTISVNVTGDTTGTHTGAVIGNADTATKSTYVDFTYKNRLINGCTRVNQRAVTSAADDTYIHDRWYTLTSTGNVGISTLADVEDGTPSMIRLTQPDVTAKRIGMAQIVESANCKDLRGKQVTFRLGRFRCSSAQAIRWAILEWTGTADTVTSDVVADWTSASYTSGGFFSGTTLTVAGVGTMTPGAETLTTGDKLTATISSSMNNLIVMIWTEGTLVQNGTLDLCRMQLENGSQATEFEQRPITIEEQLCCRRAEWVAGVIQATNQYQCYFFKVRKAKTPALSITFASGTGGTFGTVPQALVATANYPEGVDGIYQSGNHSATVVFKVFADSEL